MGDALRERLSDAGSIPARSIKAADLVCRLCQFTEPRKEISGLRQHAVREDYENKKRTKYLLLAAALCLLVCLVLLLTGKKPDPEGVSKESDGYPSARLFAGGRGRAYIGYSEAMDVMGEKASDMDFRLFSMTNGENIPVFYVDAAAVNAKIAEEKRGLALEFLNMITGRELLARVLANDGDPRYLLSARYSVYDELGAGDLIYAKLKTVAAVPRAFVFRIKPDGDAYLDAAAEKVETENLYD